MAPFEDVSQWPVSRYMREVAAKQPDGRALLLGSAINFGAGFLIAVLIIMKGSLQFGTWLNVVLFICVPFVGLVMFLRDMPSPRLTAFMGAPEQATVRTGTWLYDSIFNRPVRILRLNRDYWFDLAQADGLFEKDEEARLNEYGFLYYVRFGEEGESPFPMSVGFERCEDAMHWAESKVSSLIVWDAKNDG